MTEALIWRSQINRASEIRISLTDIILAATAKTLIAHPRLNAHVREDTIILKKKVNIGLAVSVEDGLIVPVIPDASQKTLSEISREAREKIEAARSGKLLTNEMATFTISNLGMYSIDMFIPVIIPPECGILAVGKTAMSPEVYQGKIRIRDTMTVSLACDHRVVDGVQGARFLEALKHSLEDVSILKELL
jgi:pyruvate dehydrogenase E2 component (dihydrolipoamide acetyltransferase)